MAIKTAAKLRKKTAKARKRNARASERQAQVKSKRRSSPTDHLFWVEQGDDLISRTVPFSRQLNAVPPERASERGSWVSRPNLRVGDVLRDRACRLVEIVSLPADLSTNPRVRPLVPGPTAGPRRAPVFVYWVVEGEELMKRPVVTDVFDMQPPSDKPGRWVLARDLRLHDIVIGASGDRQRVIALSDDPGALPVLVPLADCDLYWVVSGLDLDSRPSRFDVPPPASAESGRWISRRHFQVGDMLLLERGEFARVINVPERIDDDPRLLHLTRMYEFTIHRPSTIRCTPKHPFYVRDKGWTAAGELRPGDLLMTLEGDWVPVDRTEDRGEVEPVYNLNVAEAHTYFVAGTNGGPAVLVHNESGGIPAVDSAAPGMPNAVSGAASNLAGTKVVPVAFVNAATADDLNKDWNKIVEDVEKNVLGKVVGGGLTEWEKLPAADQTKLKAALKEALGAYLATVLGKAPNDVVQDFLGGFNSLRWILDVDPAFRGNGIDLKEVERKKKYTITLKPDLTVPNLNFKPGHHTWGLGITITITW
jgi:Pretoxin HINT domain